MTALFDCADALLNLSNIIISACGVNNDFIKKVVKSLFKLSIHEDGANNNAVTAIQFHNSFYTVTEA